MTSLGKEKEYEISRRKQIERKQKMMAIISVISFGGSMVFGMGQLFSSAWKQPNTAVNNGVAVEQESPLVAEARGYELVLEREPNNQVALEGLVNVRLKMGEPDKAVVSLEKLIQLNPGRQDYKTLLEEVKKRTKQSK
ncbi:tetratricopeptide repeat protein [Ancylothrix sp. C2]|uniref:tetratricopeptide repeat protein n=1 Tax=Ancylothrix sp. D3o TaxID=2953691 RepID=UPI0021BA89CA|nr:tetratricopeptide repeat protein [Ancylothrix sp. D3o]MCT7948840.1 tetratricopeptide repeat protein [Ancylothrix sp. D3o]